MGSISFQVVGDADVGTKTKTFAVANPDIDRLVAWAKVTFRKPEDAEELTVAQALLRWADFVMTHTKSAVITHERENASISFDAV